MEDKKMPEVINNSNNQNAVQRRIADGNVEMANQGEQMPGFQQFWHAVANSPVRNEGQSSKAPIKSESPSELSNDHIPLEDSEVGVLADVEKFFGPAQANRRPQSEWLLLRIAGTDGDIEFAAALGDRDGEHESFLNLREEVRNTVFDRFIGIVVSVGQNKGMPLGCSMMSMLHMEKLYNEAQGNGYDAVLNLTPMPLTDKISFQLTFEDQVSEFTLEVNRGDPDAVKKIINHCSRMYDKKNQIVHYHWKDCCNTEIPLTTEILPDLLQQVYSNRFWNHSYDCQISMQLEPPVEDFKTPCTLCDKNITGQIFWCQSCPLVTICTECHNAGKHKHHLMLCCQDATTRKPDINNFHTVPTVSSLEFSLPQLNKEPEAQEQVTTQETPAEQPCSSNQSKRTIRRENLRRRINSSCRVV